MNRYSHLKVVVVGGGTGLSTMLRGIKKYTENITAIVTVADDGGGSGVLRDDLGMLPPGDIRNCILALAETEPVMERLLSYRFTDGSLAGQSFGNLFLAAMHGISDNFEEAVKKVSDVLKVKGTVLPVTLTDVHINAHLEDGSVIKGECNISKGLKIGDKKIKRIELVPDDAEILPDALESIKDADVVVLGPGSIYTSIIPNLIVNGVSEAICKTKARVIYVCNIMSQPGESDEMTAFDHVQAIINHSCEGMVDTCIVNTETIPLEFLKNYNLENASEVRIDEDKFEKAGIKLVKGNFISIKDGRLVRHDYDKLAKTIFENIK